MSLKKIRAPSWFMKAMIIIGISCAAPTQWATSRLTAPPESAQALTSGEGRAAASRCETFESTVVMLGGTGIFADWIGSGVSVGDGRHVLTAFHCVEESNGSVGVAQILCDGDGDLSYGDRFHGQVVAMDSSADVALVRLSDGFITPMRPTASPPMRGEELFLFGSVSRGSSGVSNGPAKVNGVARRGDSGGAVVNLRGELVGIAIQSSTLYRYDTGEVINGYNYVPFDVIKLSLTDMH